MHTKVAITLSPKLGELVPEVLVSVPGYLVRETLYKTKTIELEFNEPFGWLEVVFMNKPDLDEAMAVVVDKVEFFGIYDPKFVWAGIYTPKYPEPWYSQQVQKPPPHLPNQNYMGWNGIWRLDFTIPVFTWMHQTLNLGWIYQ